MDDCVENRMMTSARPINGPSRAMTCCQERGDWLVCGSSGMARAGGLTLMGVSFWH
jgi:hypothetical protein